MAAVPIASVRALPKLEEGWSSSILWYSFGLGFGAAGSALQ